MKYLVDAFVGSRNPGPDSDFTEIPIFLALQNLNCLRLIPVRGRNFVMLVLLLVTMMQSLMPDQGFVIRKGAMPMLMKIQQIIKYYSALFLTLL